MRQHSTVFLELRFTLLAAAGTGGSILAAGFHDSHGLPFGRGEQVED